MLKVNLLQNRVKQITLPSRTRRTKDQGATSSSQSRLSNRAFRAGKKDQTVFTLYLAIVSTCYGSSLSRMNLGWRPGGWLYCIRHKICFIC